MRVEEEEMGYRIKKQKVRPGNDCNEGSVNKVPRLVAIVPQNSAELQ